MGESDKGLRMLEIPVDIPPPPLSPWMRLAILHSVIDAKSKCEVHDEKDGVMLRSWRKPDKGALLLDSFMLHLQVEGRSWFWMEALNGSIDVETGDLIFLPPGLVYNWNCTTETHLAVHFDLHAKPELPANYDIHFVKADPRHHVVTRMPVFLLRYTGDTPDRQMRIPLVTRLKSPDIWRQRLELLVWLFETQSDNSLEASLTIGETIQWALCSLHRTNSENNDSFKCIDAEINALIVQMKDPRTRLQLKNLNLDELARRTCKGLTAFREAFKRATGETPRRYLVRQEMEYAAYLLVSTDAAIKQVARSAGYEDSFHFTRLFHQIMGVSPSEYRARSRRTP